MPIIILTFIEDPFITPVISGLGDIMINNTEFLTLKRFLISSGGPKYISKSNINTAKMP